MPAGSASRELRKGIFLRMVLAAAALVALMLAWYAVDSDESRAPLAIPAGNTEATSSSAPVASKATATGEQPVIAGLMVREEPVTLPGGSASALFQDKPAAHDPLHSEGIIRTLQDPASAEKTDGEKVAPASASQPTAKPKLPGGAYLQVGVFTHPANAADLKAKLEAEGIPVVIATRVQVGPFKNKKEAEEMRERLKAMGMASIVINQ